MGAIADVTSEFKGAKKPEKVMIVIGVLAVAGVAYYVYRYKQATATQQGVPTSTGVASSLPTGYPVTGQNQTPTIPFGVNPIFDPSGNLIAFQNPGPGGGSPPVTTPSQPANWFTNFLGNVGYGTKITAGGVDTNGQRFWLGNGNSSFFYAPVGSKLNYGAQGRIWLTPPGGTQQLLTGPGQTVPTLSPNTTAVH
jgi:hypothetical protein